MTGDPASPAPHPPQQAGSCTTSWSGFATCASQMRRQRGLTQAQVAQSMGVSQARVSRMEHGDVERMHVESIAAYVTAIGGHLRLVADFGQATTTFIDYTEALTG